jgi:hypothetical protein
VTDSSLLLFWFDVILFLNYCPLRSFMFDLFFYFSLANCQLFELLSPIRCASRGLSDDPTGIPIRYRPSKLSLRIDDNVNVRHYHRRRSAVTTGVAAEWRLPYRRWWCSPTDPTVDVRSPLQPSDIPGDRQDVMVAVRT